MTWSETTNQALEKWLRSQTFHTAGDEHRFYDFVLAVWDDVQSLWDEAAARETMTNVALRFHPEMKELVDETIERRQSDGTLILDFLCRVKKNRRNIV